VTVAFTLPGGVPVYAFSLLVGAGASLGLGRVITSAPGEVRGRSAAAGFAVLLIALIGARVVYQFNHPAAALELPLGGLSWGGALLFGWAAVPIVAPFAGMSPARLADLLFPISATVLTAAWLGCWIDGCAYGPLSDAWYGLAARDDWGNLAVRFPVQLIGACLALLTLAATDLIRTKISTPGLAAGLWLTATGLQLAWLQNLRVDPSPAWNGIPLNLWAAWGTVLAGILLCGTVAIMRLKKN
jgi:prolipoprotein diacylglyceryltransferase